MLPDVLRAHKHALSQKPFVLDLDKGNKFSDLADNLRGLAICCAAVVSAETGKPETFGRIRKAPLKTWMASPA